ncbi:MAG TPA: hypothetical protein VNO23_10935 [Candidatus Binatia bacterium]|nr:hypothetical protein [Candidatus Binatia bacterium]
MTRLVRSLARLPGVRRLWQRFPVGSVALRARFDIWPRPAYGYGVFRAAELAVALGLPGLSVIEFGVAGGRGLLALESIAATVAAHFGVRIAVVGFDSGQGLPKPVDYRDLPYLWNEGFYTMDVEALRRRLQHAALILGDVAATVPGYLASRPDPIGFVAFDLDYYSSTRDALAVFRGPEETRLPRVFCYFDDLILPERACYNDYTGEYLALHEFNAEEPTKKLGKLPHLRLVREHPAAWQEQIYVLHDFAHGLYVTPINAPQHGTQKPL